MPDEMPSLATYRGFVFRNIPYPAPEHVAKRPDWTCRACDDEWPCESAKVAMRAEAQRTYLGMLMWGFLEEFAKEATEEPRSSSRTPSIASSHGPGDLPASLVTWFQLLDLCSD